MGGWTKFRSEIAPIKRGKNGTARAQQNSTSPSVVTQDFEVGRQKGPTVFFAWGWSRDVAGKFMCSSAPRNYVALAKTDSQEQNASLQFEFDCRSPCPNPFSPSWQETFPRDTGTVRIFMSIFSIFFYILPFFSQAALGNRIFFYATRLLARL